MGLSKDRRNTENILILRKIIDKFVRTRRSEVSWLLLDSQKECETVVGGLYEGN
jgi:hypothetical protein